jgi:tetratricopeptide (TPR) repeat protein
MIQAFCASTIAEGIGFFKKLLALYPDDAEALGELGAMYRNIEAWDLAAEQFEKVLTVDDGDELSYENLAVIYSVRGDYQKAIDLLRSKREAFAGYFGFHNRLATAYLCLHQYDLALGEARMAWTADPTDFEPIELEGLIHLVRGDPVAAEASFRDLLESDLPQFQMIGRAWLAHLALARGRYVALKAEVRAGLEHARTALLTPELRAAEIFTMRSLSIQDRLRTLDLAGAYQESSLAAEAARETGRPDYINLGLHLQGIVLAKMKRFDEADLVAKKLRESVERSGTKSDLRYCRLLEGEVSRANGDLGEAVHAFEAALSLLPRESYKLDIHILFLDALASAFYEQREWDKARETYERITALSTGRVRWGDLYARSYYWLGKIRLAQGDEERAAQSYKRFLEIWDQADPDLPEINEAKRFVAASGVRPPG